MLQTATVPVYNEVSTWSSWFPKRGEIYYCDLGQNKGSEQNGIRPVLVVSNNIGNRHSSIVQVAPITSQKKNPLPTHVILTEIDGMKTTSTICLEQTKCVSKERFFIKGKHHKITELSFLKLREVNKAIMTVYQLEKIIM